MSDTCSHLQHYDYSSISLALKMLMSHCGNKMIPHPAQESTMTSHTGKSNVPSALPRSSISDNADSKNIDPIGESDQQARQEERLAKAMEQLEGCGLA